MALNLSEYEIRYPDFPKYVWESPHPYSDVMNVSQAMREARRCGPTNFVELWTAGSGITFILKVNTICYVKVKIVSGRMSDIAAIAEK